MIDDQFRAGVTVIISKEQALKQYAEREAAWAAFAGERGLDRTASKSQLRRLHVAFAAGWGARKRAQYREIVQTNLAEGLDRARQDVLTLFPTDAELGTL